MPTTSKGGQATLNVGKDDEVAQQAAAVRARVAGGEDFARVAAEVSASSSKANGGLIGPINLADVSPLGRLSRGVVGVRGQAIIEWKNDELRKLYEKQLAQVPEAGAPGN